MVCVVLELLYLREEKSIWATLIKQDSDCFFEILDEQLHHFYMRESVPWTLKAILNLEGVI